jgi:hypothetical protein
MTAVLVLIGTIIGAAGALVAAYFQQKWARAAAMASEERQARRAARERAVAPVRRFLEVASKASASKFLREHVELFYDLHIDGQVEVKQPKDEVVKFFLEGIDMAAPTLQVEHDFYQASAAAPTKEIAWCLFIVWTWTMAKDVDVHGLRRAVQYTRSRLEEYIVNGVPAPSGGFESLLKGLRPEHIFGDWIPTEGKHPPSAPRTEPAPIADSDGAPGNDG